MRAGRIRCSRASPSGRRACTLISCIRSTSRRPRAPISSPKRTTAGPSPRSSAATPWSERRSTPRRANRWACGWSPISLSGSRDAPLGPIAPGARKRARSTPVVQTCVRCRAGERLRASIVVILFPAIDLKDGACVRLEQGDMTRATVFHRDPAAQAQAFEALGFEYLHVVDLDGAFAGKPVNVAPVERLIEAPPFPLQPGGGIRDIGTIEAWLDKGVTRVVIGTAAVRDPALVSKAASLYPARVAVALDARDGKVAVAGW